MSELGKLINRLRSLLPVKKDWRAPEIAGTRCFNCGARFSPLTPYGGIDEADGIPMCEGCWQAYERAKAKP